LSINNIKKDNLDCESCEKINNNKITKFYLYIILSISIWYLVLNLNFFPISYAQLSYNFAIVGDWGCTSDTKKTVKSIENKKPELILNLGDISYEINADCWLDIVDPIDEKMKVSIGNHDVIVPALLKQYMDHFGLTKQYYSFNYNKIHFLAISTEFLYLPGSEQYKFVDKDLLEASNNPNIKWIIVYSHKPQYSSACGNHDSCDAIKKLRDAYHPLFDKYNVDLVFSGHAHNYQRTYPLMFNEKNSSIPIITNNETKTYYDPNGQIHIIVGTGGIDIDPFSSKESYVFYQQDDNFGFLNIDVTDNESILRGEFISNNDKILDTFEIRKKMKTIN
jgi:predicted MPP superfamily phosphohydrolase